MSKLHDFLVVCYDREGDIVERTRFDDVDCARAYACEMDETYPRVALFQSDDFYEIPF